MIFVTLGTQDKPFKRLIKAVERQVILGNIKEEVIVQSGCTKYKSDKVKIIEYMNSDDFNKYLKEARVVICHAGVGTIIKALNENKKVIAAARKSVFGEHVNNHQEQILDNFTAKGYILPLKRFRSLNEVLDKVDDFKPEKYKSNNDSFCKYLENEIENILSI